MFTKAAIVGMHLHDTVRIAFVGPQTLRSCAMLRIAVGDGGNYAAHCRDIRQIGGLVERLVRPPDVGWQVGYALRAVRAHADRPSVGYYLPVLRVGCSAPIAALAARWSHTRAIARIDTFASGSVTNSADRKQSAASSLYSSALVTFAPSTVDVD
jgi:hypothetical protein